MNYYSKISSFYNKKFRFFAYLLIVISIILVPINIINATKWIEKPFPGFLVYSNALVNDVFLSHWTGTTSGLKPFDTILKVDSNKIEKSEEIYEFASSKPVGSVFEYELSREGEHQVINIPTMHFSIFDFLSLFVEFFIGIILLLIGAFVYFKKPDIRVSEVFFLFCFSIGLWFVSDFDTMLLHYHGLALVFQFIFPAFVMHLGLMFPSTKFEKRKTILLVIFYFISFILLFSHFINFSSGNLPWITTYKLMWFYIFASNLFFLLSIAFSYFRPRSMLDKQRSQVVLLGALFGLLLPALWAIVFLIYEIPGVTLLAIPVVFFPLSIAYAIVKHKLFNIDVIIEKALLYGSLSGILGLCFVLMILGFNYLFAKHGGWKNPAFLVVLSVFLVVSLNPLRNKLQNILDSAFFRKRYDYENTIMNLGQAMTSILNINEIANNILSTITNTMQVSSGTFLVFNRDKNIYNFITTTIEELKNSGLKLPSEDKMILCLKQYKEEIFYEDLLSENKYKEFKEDLIATFNKFHSTLFIPLFFKNDLVGILSLGNKKSDLSFNTRDIKLLKTLANQTAIAVENAFAFKLVEDYARKLEDTNKELTQTHLQLMQAEKMSAVGQLAAGIAHEIRNPLNIIEGARYYLSTEVDHGVNNDIVSEYLGYIKNQVKRTDRLITSLINFSKPEPPNFKYIQINSILENAIVLMKKQIEDHKIKLTIDLNSWIPEIMGDQNQLWQLFINILINSVQAMPNGGELKITTGKGEFDPNRIFIKFADTGQGIEEKNISKIFDPFFTTKKNGHGLGLAICYKIVEGHKGTLKVESQIGKGSIFIIEFPIKNIAKTGVQNGEEKNISN